MGQCAVADSACRPFFVLAVESSLTVFTSSTYLDIATVQHSTVHTPPVACSLGYVLYCTVLYCTYSTVLYVLIDCFEPLLHEAYASTVRGVERETGKTGRVAH